MPSTHNATVTIVTSGFDSNVNPDPLVVTAGDTIIWKPVGGSINSFLFQDNTVFESAPEKIKNGESWKAVIKSGVQINNDVYGVYVTAGSGGEAFKIDPSLQVIQD